MNFEKVMTWVSLSLHMKKCEYSLTTVHGLYRLGQLIHML